VELRGDGATLLLPFRTGARRRVDRGTVRLRDWLVRRVDRDRPPLHEVETNLAIVRPLLGRAGAARARDATPERAPLEIHSAPDAAESLARKLESAGVSPREPIVCVHAGASWRPRAWDPARFAAVAEWMVAHYHAQVVFVGSEDERDIEASVRANIKGGRVFWLSGAISWDELHALLARSALFLGNDSGPAHLAAAAGVPSVVLFGPQDPRRFGPWSARTIVLHHPAPCWPCAQTRCVRPEAPCVNDIPVGEVTAAIARLLDVTARAAEMAPRRAPGPEPA
jgi:ADP-heptose:LPS heptosyltransferase